MKTSLLIIINYFILLVVFIVSFINKISFSEFIKRTFIVILCVNTFMYLLNMIFKYYVKTSRINITLPPTKDDINDILKESYNEKQIDEEFKEIKLADLNKEQE
ncbi:hypothetical protein SAMN05661008_00528 [Alkalithermobacter thermoalcaliphilus JW-YL-7 = DSM 7308]|uniref:Uncharacterized protein n=1 Tax=Alkalithermobacter thermoalcaliphilus JW-YL-7 = DSM 7308 TaxID=1121328 RepID=A0A150FQB2_CLOPD|nr:hypothetical protein JWYL7_0869 [[Clostridium] paradoxum JW-YL-7 = DSM 7308]SHK60255.1 hypothetical protein SAMN05661008_00528 [[Clostridium] paradoxum JW-YL-7 = DSM 7308]